MTANGKSYQNFLKENKRILSQLNQKTQIGMIPQIEMIPLILILLARGYPNSQLPYSQKAFLLNILKRGEKGRKKNYFYELHESKD